MFWINEKTFFNFSLKMKKDKMRVSVLWFNGNIINEHFIRSEKDTIRI